jgi:malate dehydrogenase (oxaloacetate-decarboxylating)(NADP+)
LRYIGRFYIFAFIYYTGRCSKRFMDEKKTRKDALEYHSKGKPGKIEVRHTKPCETQEELSLAYTPGVAVPCLEIEKDPERVWEYTTKGNSVAVVTDGTAVLGLGDIGPSAGLPVMEGKCVLFKVFADVDAFPICLDNVRSNGKTDVEKFVDSVEKISPGFGGVNVEDVAAPACFELERKLKESLDVPVFHDDQHGTAIISLAGLLNGLKMVGKKIGEVKIVFNGAGAAGIACAKFYESAGVKHENIFMCDSKGLVCNGRDNLNPYKGEFAQDSESGTLEDVIRGADVFVGLSVGDLVTKDMVKSMADKPIVYAMANPKPEIWPGDALEAGAFIVGTGRSDFSNQINNVLGFPGIFRGALDTRAWDVNEEMKLGASRALAEVVKEKVPEEVKSFLEKAYPGDAKTGMFEEDEPLKPTYVIPKPLDPRVVPRVARYVAEAAIRSGVARKEIKDLEEYEREVRKRVGRG